MKYRHAESNDKYCSLLSCADAVVTVTMSKQKKAPRPMEDDDYIIASPTSTAYAVYTFFLGSRSDSNEDLDVAHLDGFYEDWLGNTEVDITYEPPGDDFRIMGNDDEPLGVPAEGSGESGNGTPTSNLAELVGDGDSADPDTGTVPNPVTEGGASGSSNAAKPHPVTLADAPADHSGTSEGSSDDGSSAVNSNQTGSSDTSSSSSSSAVGFGTSSSSHGGSSTDSSHSAGTSSSGGSSTGSSRGDSSNMVGSTSSDSRSSTSSTGVDTDDSSPFTPAQWYTSGAAGTTGTAGIDEEDYKAEGEASSTIISSGSSSSSRTAIPSTSTSTSYSSSGSSGSSSTDETGPDVTVPLMSSIPTEAIDATLAEVVSSHADTIAADHSLPASELVPRADHSSSGTDADHSSNSLAHGNHEERALETVSKASSAGLSVGASVGIAIGCFVFTLLVAAIAYALYRYKSSVVAAKSVARDVENTPDALSAGAAATKVIVTPRDSAVSPLGAALTPAPYASAQPALEL
jgi:hypothetical protein